MVYQVPSYQAPIPQIQGVSKTDFENYVKANDAVLKNVQNHGQNLQNQVANVTSLSGKTLEEPSTPLVPTPVVSNPQKEPEQNPETSTEVVQNLNLENTAQVPPPEEEDSVFIEIPKPKPKKTINVETQDLNSPRPNSDWIRALVKCQSSTNVKLFLRNKEKLEEIAITTVNAECSAIIMNKVPEKLEDPGKFLIPCALQELNRTSALADSRASINLLPHSIYKHLGLEALTPTRMLSKLVNRSITHPMGIAEDVVVRVDGFTFLADFVVVNFEPNPRVPIILGRPFLRTAKALIDFGSTTIPSDAPFPSSSPMKTSDSTFEEFTDEFTLPNSLPPGDDVSIHKKDIHEETFQIYLNPLFEFDDNFKSSNVNPLFEEKDKDVEIKSSSSCTLTSLEESEFEAYFERDSIPPGIDLNLPPTLEVSSSNPTSPTLTREKDHSWKMSMFFSLVQFVWKMMKRNSIRKKINCLLATFLPKPLS
ncbi:reverse transcriptase domain-containing protein [Tanacetum coccineum]